MPNRRGATGEKASGSIRISNPERRHASVEGRNRWPELRRASAAEGAHDRVKMLSLTVDTCDVHDVGVSAGSRPANRRVLRQE